MSKNLPKISCLCATYNRLEYLKKSIDCFCSQTYPNKELVIVSEGNKEYKDAVLAYVSHLSRSDIIMEFLDNDGSYNLGKIRNISMKLASGQALCQWDDEDLNHPERLWQQFDHMVGNDAQVSFFTDQLQLFSQSGEMFWLDWTQNAQAKNKEDETLYLIPGTKMMFQDSRFSYPESGPEASAGEDSILLEQIYNSDVKISRFSGKGYLYIYCFHGDIKHTFSYDHHRTLSLDCSCTIDFLNKHTDTLKKELKKYKELPSNLSFYVGKKEKILSLVPTC